MLDRATPVILNAMGQPCPMPLLMLKRSLKQHKDNDILLKSSDPHSLQDVTRYCQIHSLNCQINQVSAAEFHYLIQTQLED